jgi:hypothetical protein
MELGHTYNRELVPKDLFYMCVNIKKLLRLRSICFKGLNRAIQHRFQTAVSADFCLTLSQFGKAITSWILGVSLCMSIKS